jgi:hypothetical protein
MPFMGVSFIPISWEIELKKDKTPFGITRKSRPVIANITAIITLISL